MAAILLAPVLSHYLTPGHLTVKPAGSSAVLNNANAVSSTFTADKPGDYVVRLTVQGTFDNEVYSNADTVLISTTNSSPVADAGSAQTIHPVSIVMLDGTHSLDPDGDNISYSWSLQAPLGSSAVLDNASAPTPSFTVDKPGTYTATLIVNDGFADSDPTNVVISTSNSAPVANAGTSLSTTVGSQVALNGASSSDSDGDGLSYSWSFLSIPIGSQAALSDIHSATPSFIADKAGTYVAGLVVNDGFTDSSQETVQALAIVNQSGVIQEIQDLQQYISSLNSADFKNSNMQNTLLNKLNAIIKNVSAGSYADAVSKLQDDVLGKVSSCTLKGNASKSDWIINCSSQINAYQQVQSIISHINSL
jgi:hypothetical protein